MNRPPPIFRRGFTLIETMIAMSLALIIISTALAGFRVASQSCALAQRMSTENGLVRAGMLSALEEVDSWKWCDDADDPVGNIQLRQFDAKLKRGLPFTPFTPATFPRAAATDPERETERGWDPAYEWPANDPRTWFQGNLGECTNAAKHPFGRYEIFTHVKPAPKLGAAYGIAAPKHQWLPNQLVTMKSTLLYYGLLDYLPANTIYAVYGDFGNDKLYFTGDDDDTGYSNDISAPGTSFQNTDGNTEIPRDSYRMTKDTSYGIAPGNRYTPAFAAPTLTQLITENRRFFNTGQYADNASIGLFLDETLANASLLQVAPRHWPQVNTSVSRYICYSHFTNLCKVRWTSPLTGQSNELSFTTFATSLRGARQQRNLDQ